MPDQNEAGIDLVSRADGTEEVLAVQDNRERSWLLGELESDGWPVINHPAREVHRRGDAGLRVVLRTWS